MKRVLQFLFFCVFGMQLRAQIPVLGADSLMKHYTWKMNHFIDRDSVLRSLYAIDLYGVSVFAGEDLKKQNQPEYRVNWSDLQLFKNIIASAPREEAMQILLEKGGKPFPPEIVKQFSIAPEYITPKPNAKQPLKGLRIALDPGHIADDTAMGRVEDKYLLFKTFDGKDSVTISIAEGMLTFQTATLLAAQLKTEGAEVFITRPAADLTAFGKTFQQWKKDDFERTLDSLLRKDPGNAHYQQLKRSRTKPDNLIFRYVFKDAELRKRAELINAFHPDLTVIIHFNVDEKNKPWSHASDKDFCMAFVAGSFQGNELGDSERRFDFLRLLLTDEIENSISASSFAAKSFADELNVPLAKQADATYLVDNCVPAGPDGVFCRNLSLTRLVQGTIIYGETLYQDNEKECLHLVEKSKFSNGGNFPFGDNDRLDQVANAYHKAILNWAKSR